MSFRPLVFTHVHKCAGSSLRRMLHAKFKGRIAPHRMHVPEITCDAHGNLPMMEERGESLPAGLLLLADHSPCGLYDERVLAPGEPFKVTLLRSPLDRLESYYHFCVRADFIPREWAAHSENLQAMPEETLGELCRRFEETSGYIYWFDPQGRDPGTALRNLLQYEVLARHDDLIGFCERFNARNPYGVRFGRGDVLHVNRSERPSRFTGAQRELAGRMLAGDLEFWNTPEVQHAISGRNHH